MSMQTDFIVLASPALDGRVFPKGTAPTVYAGPYATFFRVAAVEGATIDTNGGTDNEVNTRLQVDVYARSYTEVQALASAIKAALKGWEYSNIVLMDMDGHEPDVGLHSVTLDLSVWH